MTIDPALKNFMENLWDAKGLEVPSLGEIVSVRTKLGLDLQATIMDSEGELSIWDGTELFEMFPQLFS